MSKRYIYLPIGLRIIKGKVQIKVKILKCRTMDSRTEIQRAFLLL